MKALMYIGEKQLRVEEVAKPEGEFLVRVLGTTICGTDLKTYLKGHSYFQPPCVLGHEFYGEVVKTPEGLYIGMSRADAEAAMKGYSAETVGVNLSYTTDTVTLNVAFRDDSVSGIIYVAK